MYVFRHTYVYTWTDIRVIKGTRHVKKKKKNRESYRDIKNHDEIKKKNKKKTKKIGMWKKRYVDPVYLVTFKT